MRVLLAVLSCGFGWGLFAQSTLTGAWQANKDGNQVVLLIADKFYCVAVYRQHDNHYIGTYGGTFRMEKDKIIYENEFNTLNKDDIGVVAQKTFLLKGDVLTFGLDNFTRLDAGTPGQLAGAWVITGRMTTNGMQPITPGARKTMKILSGTRFQWIAYNSETKEFFGTGGGTYTTENGKYTETIDVFSRDNSRVGAKLEFDFSLVDGRWQHRGKSSSGQPIDEVWTQRQKLGI